MPKLRGTAALNAKAERAANGGGGSSSGGRKAATFTPLFGLRVGETAYLKFYHDDVEETFLHTWVRVPPTSAKGKERGYDWEVFASRTRNEGYSDEVNILETELDHWPTKKFAGIAVLLDPVYDGKGTKFQNIKDFEVQGNTVTRDDGETFYPRWQLIFEAFGSFWENILMIANTYGLTQYPIQVTRIASDNYQFVAFNHLETTVDWDTYKDLVPTVEDELARLGSDERYEHYFGEGKPRITKQDQRHNFLAQWIQDERNAYLESIGADPSDEEADEAPVQEVPKKSGRKPAVSFSDLEGLDENKEVASY